MPAAFTPVSARVRRAIINPFDYLIFFVDAADCVRVIAIVHARRDPSYIAGRISRE